LPASIALLTNPVASYRPLLADLNAGGLNSGSWQLAV